MADLANNLAATLIRESEAAKEARAVLMPTEEHAVRMMWSAFQRLRELGWKETCYAPTGVSFPTVSPGSAGIHIASRWEDWPSKDWMVEDRGDLWPDNPCLFKPLDAEEAANG